jgi:hypothetical protein
LRTVPSERPRRFAIATLIVANASKLASVTTDLKTYCGVYLAGGATAIEVIGAIQATLSVSDWLLLLGAIGISSLVMGHLLYCEIQAFQAGAS